MRRINKYNLLAIVAIYTILIAAGCKNVISQPEKPVLKSTLTDTITYKVTTDRENGVIWQGPQENKPKNFIGGHSGNKIEMTFTRQIQNVDPNGSAIVKITVKEIKYISKVRDKIVLDFDSSLQQNSDNPLSKLIGQKYTIELNVSGEVSKIIDVNDARTAIGGSSISNARASQLLSLPAITEQHSVPLPLTVNNKQLTKGRKWNNIKTFSFGQMGAKTFERNYEIIKISEVDGRQIAIAQMNAVPSTAKAKELYKEQSTGLLSSMFDNIETYTGVLSFDLTSGQIEKYNEEFRSVWTAVDPLASKQESEPDRFQMSATRIYRLERID